HARGEIKRFAKSFQGANGHEVPKLVAPTGGDGDETPEQAPAEDEVLATKAVADQARDRRAGGIDPHERGADEAKLHFVEAEFLLQLREYREDRLSISIIEEADQPEHRHNPPFVGASMGSRNHFSHRREIRFRKSRIPAPQLATRYRFTMTTRKPMWSSLAVGCLWLVILFATPLRDRLGLRAAPESRRLAERRCQTARRCWRASADPTMRRRRVGWPPDAMPPDFPPVRQCCQKRRASFPVGGPATGRRHVARPVPCGCQSHDFDDPPERQPLHRCPSS